MGLHAFVHFGMIALIAVVCATGCDGDTGRFAVTGTVQVYGQPLATGAIVIFEPLEQQGTAATATVTGGTFDIPKSSGLRPGKYLIRITAGDGKTAINPVDPDSPPGPGGSNIISKDLIPEDWNVNSKHEVTVAKDSPNKFDFVIP